MEKEALIIVDMINDFVHPDGALYVKDSEKIIPFIEEKIREFREKNFPIIYAIDHHTESDKEFELFPKHAVKGTWGAKIVEDLSPVERDIIIYKRRYPAFFGTDLDLLLRELNIKKIYIVGVVTHICIFYTAMYGRLLEYEVSVYKDGVYDFDKKLHDMAISQLKDIWGVKIL